MKKTVLKKWICFYSSLLILLLSILSPVYALTPAESTAIKNTLPSSAQPAVVGQTLMSQEPVQAQSMQPLPKEPREGEGGNLGPEAAKIKFKLTKVTLIGNHVYSTATLEKLYQDKIDTIISIAELQNIVQQITNFYRNNGYIISRAILPPQRVKEGAVTIQVLEGFIDQVNIVGNPRGARRILMAYGQHIADSKPLQIKVMEHYLRLSNEVPGLQAKAVLEPAKKELGASDLNLTAEQQTLNGYATYDNYGTRYIGPLQIGAGLSANSIFRSGDVTSLSLARATRQHELKFYDASYQSFLGTNGMTLRLGKTYSATQPQFTLADLDILGNSESYYANFQYPYLRARDRNLTFDWGSNYQNSLVKSFGSVLYDDHIRPIQAGLSYDFADRYKGSNLLAFHVTQGLNLFGASNNPNSLTTSRFGATGIFTKWTLQATRLQQIVGRHAAYGYINGQYSYSPLLTGQQIAFGGNPIGRGYDPAEIIGDRGAGGTLELRASYAPGLFLLRTAQLYLFYDAAEIWNIKNIAGSPKKQSLTSTGFGMRFSIMKYISGNVMYTQPLTKKVAAEELVFQGTNPRVYFSLAANV